MSMSHYIILYYKHCSRVIQEDEKIEAFTCNQQNNFICSSLWFPSLKCCIVCNAWLHWMFNSPKSFDNLASLLFCFEFMVLFKENCCIIPSRDWNIQTHNFFTTILQKWREFLGEGYSTVLLNSWSLERDMPCRLRKYWSKDQLVCTSPAIIFSCVLGWNYNDKSCKMQLLILE